MRLLVKLVQQQPCSYYSQTTYEKIYIAHKQYSSKRSSITTIKMMSTTLPRSWEDFIDPVEYDRSSSRLKQCSRTGKIGKKWREYQGSHNWDGLLDPLDDNLREEIIRYGKFVDVTYRAFDFDVSSDTYGTCKYSKNKVLDRCGLTDTGYRITKNLRATSGIRLPCWMQKVPPWISVQSSWIGYVAVCHDKEEIARLGRRDVVIALRGTVTCLEWLENLRASLTSLTNADDNVADTSKNSTTCMCRRIKSEAMVESGFFSLYTSSIENCQSLQQLIQGEISRLLQLYNNEPLSITITGHSLGAALATLAANDIKTTFNKSNIRVTVISFGGPRVGNYSFRHNLEKQGTKVLRIVNSDDVITKVPGFVIDNNNADISTNASAKVNKLLPSWIQKRVESTQWVYSEVGRELRLRSRDSPYLTDSINIATCHDLKTYLHLVEGFVSTKCPFRITARKMLKSNYCAGKNVIV